MKKLVDLGISVDESILSELEDAYATRFGYKEEVIDPNPKWKPTKKQPSRPLIKNISKKEFMAGCIKRTIRKTLAEDRAEREIKIKRDAEKSLEELI